MTKLDAVVVYSGGMDSFTLLHEVVRSYRHVAAISFDYGQRHKKELHCATRVCRDVLGIEHQVVELHALTALLSGSSLTSTGVGVPEGHYAADNMRKTVVPNRNMIMISIASGFAISRGARRVHTAVHSGDHDVYPDCRPEFIDAVSRAVDLGNYGDIVVDAPYLEEDKSSILLRGSKIGLTSTDYKDTWTCYNGREKACGKCGACVERLEAFSSMKWDDPVPYEDRNFWKEALGGNT